MNNNIKSQSLHKCVIIGSFRKFYNNILELIQLFEIHGITILSPAKSKIVNPDDEFIILESNIINSDTPGIKHIEDDVLNAIKGCDFLYVFDPQGYVGNSTNFEIGFAKSEKKENLCIIPSFRSYDITIY